ncbi:hypothetical protein FSP39_014554 [Pinctada imbricata]|uniref:Transposable element P transposase-like RNase H domain-containing protein n=1 Tax=Pinctada imbricata TaxID=66713 RepID=A0AA88YV93_PINIB|nr:hypothetical protein FSP39_014554 [Pinctada imbricata]
MSTGSETLTQRILSRIRGSSTEEFIDFNEVKEEFPDISSQKFGKLISKIFPNVESKRGRDRSNWAGKLVQRYYGITWLENKENENANQPQFSSIKHLLPGDFIFLSQSENSCAIGFLSGIKINENRVMTELTLMKDGTWSISALGKTLNPKNVGVNPTYTIDMAGLNVVFETARNIRYCEGFSASKNSECAAKVECYKEDIKRVIKDQEQVVCRYRSKSCTIFLPFSSTNTYTCIACKEDERKCNYIEEMQDSLSGNDGKDEKNSQTEDTVNDQGDVTLCESDHKDLKSILENIFPDCSSKMSAFWLSQKQALERKPHGRRWNSDVIRVCLTLWCRSPRGYRDLRSSGLMILPSEKILQIYKNSVHQEAGFQKEMLKWMAEEAKVKNLSPEGYVGGLIIDEMSLQPDLQFSSKDGVIELIGFTEVVPESIVMNEIKTKKKERNLATHALQLVFLGLSGFRFPVAHFPTCTASANELYLLVWKSVHMLSLYGFQVEYISTDGAQCNRDLMKLLLPNFKSSEPVTCSFTNFFCNSKEKIHFIMDCSHVFKKIRNNVYKSGSSENSKRTLTLNSGHILWDHFKNAYVWDITSNPFPIYHKLSQDHFSLTSENKMRNYLAEDVLNSEMLNLMKQYKVSLGTVGKKLDSTIDFLENTSVMINIFRDSRPIIDHSDDRLRALRDVLTFFIKWENSVKKDTSIQNKEKFLISHQTREDIVSCILGFVELCDQRLKNGSSSIIPSRLNSDVVENLFCQQRTLHNGANSNPTYLGYCRTINSVVLGQSSISRKSNTGGNDGGTTLFQSEKVNLFTISSKM